MPVSVKVESKDIAWLSKQIRKSGDAKRIRRDLAKGLKVSASPGVSYVRAAALSLPSGGSSRSGLRRKMASAVGTQVRTSGDTAGVAVRISRAKMGKQAALPKVTNVGRWRHPVFQRRGSKVVWVNQYSTSGWFDRAAQRPKPQVQKAVQGVMDNIAKELEHH